MKQLIIVGAGGFGRELYAWASQHPDYGRAWTLAGFIDDNPDALAAFHRFAPVSPITGHKPTADNVYLCGLGTPALKEKFIAPLVASGAEFLTFVHPQALIGARVKLGKGAVVCPGAVLSVDIEVGDFVMINLNCTIGHDARIGPWTSLSAQCDITGGATVGKACFFGSRATIIPGKSVGDRTVIAAGAVVMTHLPSDVLAVGSPARIL
jgi:sugar O-acyltransferase (sialic acid O-acetyltransferase NeuD family)